MTELVMVGMESIYRVEREAHVYLESQDYQGIKKP